MRRSGILRYSIDIWPLLLVLTTAMLGLLPFVRPLPRWELAIVWAAAMYLRTFCPFVQHNHSHAPIFRPRLLNHVFDAILTQNTGYPTAIWQLHHSLGHHRQYLDPGHDVASPLVHGVPMSRWAYAVRGNLTILRDSIRVGLSAKRPKHRALVVKLSCEIAIQLSIVGVLLSRSPCLTVAFFVLPNAITPFMIWWESYPHHLDMPTTGVYDAAMTTERRDYNFFTFNIGHHTAHHLKPTLHWSLLPGQTAKIRHLIPARCFSAGHTTVGMRWR